MKRTGAVLIVFALALVLRAAFAPLLPLNLDEVFSGPAMARHTLWETANPFSALNQPEPHPTLHFVSMNLWMQTGAPLLQRLGIPEAGAVRGLSVLCGALAAGLLAAAGFRIHPAAGWTAGLAAALSSYATFMAGEARMYSLMECASALLLLLWVGFSLQGTFTRRQQAGWVAASFLLMQSHYNGIPLTLLYWLALALTLPKHRKKLLLNGCVLTLLYLPWLLALKELAPEETAGGIQPSSGLILPYTLYAFSGGEVLYHFGSKREVLSRLPLIAAVLLPAALIAALLFPALRNERKVHRNLVLGSLLIAAVFLTALWLGSFKIPKLFRSVRYAVGAAPLIFFALGTVAAAAWNLKKYRPALLAAAGIWLGINAWGFTRIARKQAAEYTPWPQVAEQVQSLRPDQVLVYISFMKHPLLHYGPGLPVHGLEEAPPDYTTLLQQCPGLSNSQRIALIISHPRAYEVAWIETLSQHFDLEKAATFHRVDIYLGQTRTGPSRTKP